MISALWMFQPIICMEIEGQRRKETIIV